METQTNIDQIVAEAAKQIIAMPMINEYLIDDVADIIKAAFEKARKADKQTERERMNAVDERYRAAHASETCETCGRPSIENGIATHLSDHSFKP